MTLSQGQAALFYKDQPGEMESASYLGGNTGYLMRAEPTKDGGAASLEGYLCIDFDVDQIRSILNGVSINIKLFQSINEFRLMCVADKR